MACFRTLLLDVKARKTAMRQNQRQRDPGKENEKRTMYTSTMDSAHLILLVQLLEVQEVAQNVGQRECYDPNFAADGRKALGRRQHHRCSSGRDETLVAWVCARAGVGERADWWVQICIVFEGQRQGQADKNCVKTSSMVSRRSRWVRDCRIITAASMAYLRLLQKP